MGLALQTEHVVDRVERLLVRYEELQRTNALLTLEVRLLSDERDSLRSRLAAARARVEALLDRLPAATDGDEETIDETSGQPPAPSGSPSATY